MDKRGQALAERQRRYREANKEAVAERQRRYYEANKEKWKQYAAAKKAKKSRPGRKAHGRRAGEAGMKNKSSFMIP